jgi:hypothetical protein
VIDLEGWHLRDSGTDDIVLPPWQLQPGTILLLCNNPDGLTNGGLPAGLAYSGYTLANSSDEIILTDSTGLVIDSVLYTNTFSGKSWELDPGHLNTVDNDDFSNWCLAVSPYGLGDFGTPASANNFCSLGIGDASGENEMFIYTEKENLFVHSTLKQDSPWEISGINGSLVLKGVSPSTETFSISIESLTPGVYLFRMRNGKAVRFVVPE